MIPKNVTYYFNSYKTAFITCLIIIATVALYRWFVAPHRNYLEAAQKYEAAVSTMAKKKQVIGNTLKAKQITYDKLQQKYDNLQSILFEPAGERKYFSNIETICRQTGCKMVTLTFSQSSMSGSPETKDTNKQAASSSAHLTVEGGYKNIMNLMNKLQDGSKLVRIDSLNINSDSKNPGNLKCDMTITIYVTNEKKDN
jgi:Tfp pilus assembly protein PilO